ncbi:MAG TPA: hypothetical protein PK794_02330 [Armatimonadota bacterium]|nr:hypothetical protein [Armatimonadota bacterium]
MNEIRKPTRRRWARWALATLAALGVLALGLTLVSAHLYQGPRTLDAVIAAMPEAPIFPFSELTANNRAGQRAMAIPLWLLRRQGAARAETAFLCVPADPVFLRAWYTGELTKADWTLATNGQQRLVFVKNHAAIQVLIGPRRDLLTAYQLVYLDGLTDRQVAQLLAPARVDAPR